MDDGPAVAAGDGRVRHPVEVVVGRTGSMSLPGSREPAVVVVETTGSVVVELEPASVVVVVMLLELVASVVVVVEIELLVVVVVVVDAGEPVAYQGSVSRR